MTNHVNHYTLLAALLSATLAAPVLAADDATPVQRQPQVESHDRTRAKAPSDNKPRRLESITWNSVEHRLTWVISTGDREDGKYKANESQTYNIELDKAVMVFKEEKRGFSDQEAASVHALMDLLSKYAVESTVWWDNGQGVRLDKDGKPDPVQQVPERPQHDRKKKPLAIAQVTQ